MNLNIPRAPNLTITPLSNIENSTEASTCALSNHEKQGQIGNFTPKPNRNIKLATLVALVENLTWSSVKIPSEKYNIKPTNKKILPAKVQKNISVTASPIRSDLAVNLSKNKDDRSNDSKLKKIIINWFETTKRKPTNIINKIAFMDKNFVWFGFNNVWLKKITKGRIQAISMLFCHRGALQLDSTPYPFNPPPIKVKKSKKPKVSKDKTPPTLRNNQIIGKNKRPKLKNQK
jgi:hypothetical protein